MHPILVATLVGVSRTLIFSEVAGVVVLVIGVVAWRDDVARARGLEKIVALASLFYAMPLATFAGEHLSGDKGIIGIVPKYMPWPVFWAYFVGFAMMAAALSMATKIQVHWAALGFGSMMFLFVALIDLPGTLRAPHNRIIWMLMLRELSFGGGAWALAAALMNVRTPARRVLFTIGRVLVGIAAVAYAIQHFLHPVNVPGVPLVRIMPTWMPRTVISYLTGIILLVCGGMILAARKTRTAATYLGSWIFLIVVVIYGPILVGALMDSSPAQRLEGVNYFEDTLLFAAAILAVAQASPKPSEMRGALHSEKTKHILHSTA